MSLPIVFGQDKLKQFDSAVNNEWLITNGLGGYASSTVLGLNTRKYHALLVAALRPPGERTVVLSKLDEDIEVDGKTFRLGANDFKTHMYPEGFNYLKEFSLAPFPTFLYSVDGMEIRKTVFLPYGTNSAVALYEFSNQSNNDSTARIYPLISFRHFHDVLWNPIQLTQNQKEQDLELTFDNPKTAVILRASQGAFVSKPVWVQGLFYREEERRGESNTEASYQPGCFEFQVPRAGTAKFAISTAADDSLEAARKTLDGFGLSINDIAKRLTLELDRRKDELTRFYGSRNLGQETDGLSWLLQAANDFVVRGTGDRRFVIAGYQWFGSWGRDTFVSLPGLMLVNGRFDDAKNVISDYARYYTHGLIPNLIDDKTGEPLYNTVDGTLWYINAIWQYLKYSGNFDFAANFLWPILKDTVEHYRKGTMNDIRIDDDGLLAHGPQLTWMDTIVDGLPYTPRSGKAVEVQALWYNALRILQALAAKYGERSNAENFSAMAEQAKQSFNKKFFNNDTNSLFDVLDEKGNADFSIRPNQVIAGALDFPIIEQRSANLMVDFVLKELFTPVGLRTLSPRDSRYRGKYEGDRASRDRAYHSGSIWPWLTGPLTTAYLKAKGYSDSNVKYAMDNFIQPLFSNELARGGLGTINEIYDGDRPFMPRGCIAQAWSVAEPLRAYVEDILLIRPKYEEELIRTHGMQALGTASELVTAH